MYLFKQHLVHSEKKALYIDDIHFEYNNVYIIDLIRIFDELIFLRPV